MGKTGREKHFWRSHFGILNPAKAPLEIHHLNYRDTEFTDEQLNYLTARLKRIDRLDLDSTFVTNEGISYLPRLEVISELRLKGLQLDDYCVPALRQLQSLELLHLGGTKMSCHGIASLSPLKILEKLLCSPYEILPQQLKNFREAVPKCELIVNCKSCQPQV